MNLPELFDAIGRQPGYVVLVIALAGAALAVRKLGVRGNISIRGEDAPEDGAFRAHLDAKPPTVELSPSAMAAFESSLRAERQAQTAAIVGPMLVGFRDILSGIDQLAVALTDGLTSLARMGLSGPSATSQRSINDSFTATLQALAGLSAHVQRLSQQVEILQGGRHDDRD